jgi:indolepyruvate ferredoxin oxidoreductase alpha subunit
MPPRGGARFVPTSPIEFTAMPAPLKHHLMIEKLKKVREIYEASPFEYNWYVGPERPELLLVTSGACWFYSQEAVKMVGAEGSVGILKLGTTWPLPEKLVIDQLVNAERVLVVEEVAPFLEGNLKELVGDNVDAVGPITFYGKRSGHVPDAGELNPDVVSRSLSSVLGVETKSVAPDYAQKAQELTGSHTHMRAIGFCAGCPHRASFWSLKNALKLDGRNGFVAGDIGCYTMALGPTGFFQLKTVQSMGSGVGLACGFGNLDRSGFEQPTVAVCGDSTFFHAAIPALVNGVYNRSNFTLLVLDNSATAMTGFQPHPGTGSTATEENTPSIDIEAVCRSMGIRVEVTDPFDIEGTTQKLLGLMREDGGVRVLISKRTCELVRGRKEDDPYQMSVDTDKCRGDDCGCSRLCTRVFQCPGLIWDTAAGAAQIDEVICNGCGVCTDVCPAGAIMREAS